MYNFAKEAYNKSSDYFAIFVKHGVDIKKIKNFIQLAIYNKDLQTVKLCLKTGIPIDERNDVNSTPLYSAISNNNYEIAEYLIKEGALSGKRLDEYNRSVYELYFANYYPDISVYESTSRVPLLRNYYYHEYISQGIDKYIFIFDDCVSASFETDGGTEVSFYGFYSNMEDGAVINDETEHTESVDSFMKQLIRSIAPLTMYAYAMNIFSMIPFIALMPLVVTLLAYSVLKIGGIETVSTFGATFRILGSYVWFSALISAVLTVVASFIVSPKAVSSLPLALFFVALVLRSLMFAVREVKTHKSKKQSEKETVLTEA